MLEDRNASGKPKPGKFTQPPISGITFHFGSQFFDNFTGHICIIYIIIHIIRWSPGSLALLCRWRVRFSVRRSWLFFDISILSRRPFCNLCNRCRIEPVARSQRGQPVNPGHRPDVVPRARLMQRVRSGLREWSLPPSSGNLETLNISFFGAVWCALVRSGALGLISPVVGQSIWPDSF